MVNPKFIVNLHGKDFVLFSGLLDLAHQDGLKSIETDIVQFPLECNDMTCVITAKVVTDIGTFTGIGDANPQNVGNKAIALHCIRMAETRAVARALRFATNIGMTALEELGGDVADEPTHAPAPTSDKPMTEKQRGMLESFTEQNWLGIEEQEKLTEWLKESRTASTASKAIEHYLQLKDERTKELQVA